MKLGNLSVDIVSDGSFLADGGSVFGQIPRAEWEIKVKPDRRNRIRLGLNCMAIKTPTKNILVDTGAGAKRMDRTREPYVITGNKLLKGLRALELTPRDIDLVVLTHLHFDHAGGCTKLDSTGKPVPTFPKAEYLVQRDCWEEALNPNERAQDAFSPDDFVPLEKKGVLTLIDGDTEIVPGVSTRVCGGHVNGHQMVLVEWGSERIAFVGDLIPTPHHIPLPYIPAFDQVPNDTLAHKRNLLGMATSNGWLVVFGHGQEQRAGYVEQRNGTAKLLPFDF